MSKKRQTKRIYFPALTLILCLALVAAAFAMIVRSTDTENVITFGSIKMRLIETTTKDGTETPISDGYNEDITNQNNVSRNVRIENIHNHPIYVRLKLNMDFISGNGERSPAGEVATYDYNTGDFTYKDGWWYYNNVLEPNTSTTNLITQITFNLGQTTEQLVGSKFNLKIDAQAVQSEHNAEEAINSVGWPLN